VRASVRACVVRILRVSVCLRGCACVCVSVCVSEVTLTMVASPSTIPVAREPMKSLDTTLRGECVRVINSLTIKEQST